MWSELLAFVAGAGVALLAQALGHSLTLRRERRADFVSALDKAVNAYAVGERALDEFTHVIERAVGEEFMVPGVSGYPDYVSEPRAQAQHAQADMRAALFSIRVRVRDPRSAVYRGFDSAFVEWEKGFRKAEAMVADVDFHRETVGEVWAHSAEFRRQFYDGALERAAEAVGTVKA